MEPIKQHYIKGLTELFNTTVEKQFRPIFDKALGSKNMSLEFANGLITRTFADLRKHVVDRLATLHNNAGKYTKEEFDAFILDLTTESEKIVNDCEGRLKLQALESTTR